MQTENSTFSDEVHRALSFFEYLWTAIEACGDVKAKVRTDAPAVALHTLVLEHANAIALLLDLGLSSSALALLRPMGDGYVRAKWIRECATDEDLARAMNEDVFPNQGKMFRDLAGGPPAHHESVRRLDQLHAALRNTLHSFTHGGREQLRDRIHPSGIQGNPEPGRLLAALKLAVGHGALVAEALWEIYGDDEFKRAATEAMSFAGLLTPGKIST